MPYKPILDVAELPPPGQRFPEHLHFDIKGQVPPLVLKGATGPEDLACDVAAFANANGGVILVGAHEEPRGTLKAYVAMTDKEVAAVVALYQTARDLCSPRPIINPRALERNAGEWAVAINVDAYAAPPIGVQRSDEKGGPRWWAFPARRGDENRNLRPEELATVMDAEYRRKLLRLLAIPPRPSETQPTPTLLFNKGIHYAAALLKVDADHGVAYFKAPPQWSEQEVCIPIDSMVTFWLDPSDGLHRIRIDGRLNDDRGKVHFWPVEHL
jgi:hypothetical protein